MKKYVSPILEKIRNTSYIPDLGTAHKYAISYIEGLDEMPVYPKENDIKNLSLFSDELQDAPTENKEILNLLGNYGSKATVASTGGRYFGFVTGGVMPSAVASKWLADVWDQNTGMYVMSPIGAKLETISEKWLTELLGLPEGTAAGFVSGSSMAIMCGLAAARNRILNNLGWDVAAKGLFGAPEVKVVLSEGAHSAVIKMLSVLGLGHSRVIKVPMDEQGRICVDKLPEMDSTTLLILQAGNVNSGAFDDFEAACKKAKQAGAWVHVDGAFGMWAAADKNMAHLSKGIELADSWNFDCHKTINTPYDCGVVMCRNRQALVNAMHMTGEYIILSEDRDGMLYTPEMSRRARGIDVWATLKGLGKDGVEQLIEEFHHKAVYFAEELHKNGFSILNEVVFNQVLVYYENNEKTNALLASLQKTGVMWLGGSKWRGKSVIRISVSNYKTTYEDIDMCVKEFVRLIK